MHGVPVGRHAREPGWHGQCPPPDWEGCTAVISWDLSWGPALVRPRCTQHPADGAKSRLCTSRMQQRGTRSSRRTGSVLPASVVGSLCLGQHCLTKLRQGPPPLFRLQGASFCGKGTRDLFGPPFPPCVNPRYGGRSTDTPCVLLSETQEWAAAATLSVTTAWRYVRPSDDGGVVLAVLSHTTRRHRHRLYKALPRGPLDPARGPCRRPVSWHPPIGTISAAPRPLPYQARPPSSRRTTTPVLAPKLSSPLLNRFLFPARLFVCSKCSNSHATLQVSCVNTARLIISDHSPPTAFTGIRSQALPGPYL